MKGKLKHILVYVLLSVFVIPFFTFTAFASDSDYIDFEPYIVESHPRLYVTSFEGLKEKYLSDTLTAGWYNNLLDEVAVISDGGVMCNTDGTKLYNIEVLSNGGQRRIISSQTVLARFYSLAFAAACEDSKALADRLWLEIEDAINLPNWNTRHWLEPAEMMHSISIAYDWCYKFWTDEQKQLMETKVYELGISNAVREYNGWPRWYKWHYGFNGTEIGTNWTIVCNAGVLLTSLVFYDTNPTFYNTKINNAVRSMRAGLNAYSDNGSFRENVSYWSYATRNLVMAVDAFESAIGGDFDALPPISEPFLYDFSKAPGISVTPDFPMYGNGPTGVFNYGDASSGSFTSSAALMWIGNRFDKDYYTNYHLDALENNKATGGVHELLWYEGGEREKEHNLDRLFEENFVSLRSSWDNDTALFVAMKGGINGKGHNHYDLGTFVLDANGKRFARQLGAIGYDWSGSRSEFYKGRTEGQNTILINPDSSAGQYTQGDSEFTSYYSGDGCAYAVLDMTDAYNKKTVVTSDASGEEITAVEPTDVTSVRRGVKLFNNRTRVLVQDEVKMSSPSEYYWFMHTGSNITLYNNNKSARLVYGTKTVLLNVLSDVDAEFEIMTAEPLPASPTPEDQPDTYGKKLVIHLEDITGATVAVEMIPVTNVISTFTDEIVSLDNWYPEKDVIYNEGKVDVYGTGKWGSYVTMTALSPSERLVGIEQIKIDSSKKYHINFNLPEDYENGTYSVYINGSLYKSFEVTDGTDPLYLSFTRSYDLPDGVGESFMVIAEYNNGVLKQLAIGEYNTDEKKAVAKFSTVPSAGNLIKIMYFENLNSIKPLLEEEQIYVTQ